MHYYILEGTFKENHPVGPAFKAALDAHHAYLAPYFQSGQVLVSGPKAAGGGGVMVIKFENEADVETFIANDPFVTNGVQEYRVTAFNVFKLQDYAKDWQ